MKDGKMDEMEGCNGQGHVTMEIVRQHDGDGDCCDYRHIKVSSTESEREAGGWTGDNKGGRE